MNKFHRNDMKNIDTYNAPAKKRSKIIEDVFVANVDKNEKQKPPIAATRITFFLPQVSAKKPQKCDVNTIPQYDIALSKPCASVVNSKSHFAYGKM